ncbi:unnamed protein product [Calypogeia fissa]
MGEQVKRHGGWLLSVIIVSAAVGGWSVSFDVDILSVSRGIANLPVATLLGPLWELHVAPLAEFEGTQAQVGVTLNNGVDGDPKSDLLERGDVARSAETKAQSDKAA